jgi:alkylhydroperoxidase/carboxymuconolactone decarboxylase family protein YurZ
MNLPPIKNIRDHISLPKIALLGRAYVREAALGLLNAVLPATYDKAREYSDAVAHAFYGPLPPDQGPEWRDALSLQDRERCVIALLASRRAELELAVHIYLALMEEMSPEEIANILMLVGMYTGLDNFSHSLRVEAKTLDVLGAIVDGGGKRDAETVLVALSVAFEPPALPPAS